MNIDALEENVGLKFKNVDLYKEALTHRSYLNERPKWQYRHNERLEFLGDAVLELIITDELFKKFPDSPEGQLTVLRASLVNHVMLSRTGREVGLDSFILMSKGERGDTSKAKEVILANAVEALIGAIYLDQGLPPASKFIHRFILPHLDEIVKTKSYKDAKSELQEVIQEKLKVTPTYNVLKESGPAHKRMFRIGVYFGPELIAEGEGPSKQEAEVAAAKNALVKYR